MKNRRTKMPIKNDREYRLFNAPIEARAQQEGEEKSYIVEGYASTFNDPYVLFTDNGVDYSEQIDRHAFDNCDMSDVIFQYDHEGMVYARQKNGTLELSCDDHGLKVRADLGSTEESRKIYDAIATGLLCEMSFAFTVEHDSYDKDKCLRTIDSIRKLYDCSVVSIPANPNTSIGISARSLFDGFIEQERLEQEKAEARRKQIIKIKIMTELL